MLSNYNPHNVKYHLEGIECKSCGTKVQHAMYVTDISSQFAGKIAVCTICALKGGIDVNTESAVRSLVAITADKNVAPNKDLLTMAVYSGAKVSEDDLEWIQETANQHCHCAYTLTLRELINKKIIESQSEGYANV